MINHANPTGRSTARLYQVVAAAAVAAGALVLPGCLVGGHSKSTESGKYVAPATISTIKPGETKQDWVLATLGDPTSKTVLDDGSELWKWCYTRNKTSSGYVFVIFGGSSSEQIAATTFVHLRNGVVQRVWQDSSEAKPEEPKAPDA